ncbi:MAG: nuclear transport factor 2 family protein [Gemmatimonadota bacterium]|jgi:hypothetical protein
MKSLTTLLVLILSVPAGAAAQAPEQQVLDVVERLFDGMRAADTTVMRSTFHPDVRLFTTGMREGEPVATEVPVTRWLDGVASSQSVLDERLHEPEVRVADNLASVWTFYTLHVDDELSHCGFDAFQLVLTGSGWKITQVADTRQQEGCWVPEGE